MWDESMDKNVKPSASPKKWFDRECMSTKSRLNKLANNKHAHPRDLSLHLKKMSQEEESILEKSDREIR